MLACLQHSQHLHWPRPYHIVRLCVDQGTRTLIATGTVLSADPDRIILKEVLLSGYPVKVKHKKAVIKYMFFNADDVRV